MQKKKKTNWNKRYMDVAKLVASWSKDKSVGVGAVITKNNRIIATGYNGFAERVNDDIDERHERPAKYDWTVHAEENAILSAALNGISTDDTIMYCTWFPCAPCARKIINAGIKKIVCGQRPDMKNKKFGAGFAITLDMLGEAGVDIEYEEDFDIIKIDIPEISEEQALNYIKYLRKKLKIVNVNNGSEIGCECGKKTCDCDN